MRIIKNVHGSKEASKAIIIGKDTVYIHSNIKKIEFDFEGNPIDNLYEYDEVQYTKDEYIQLMAGSQVRDAQLITDLELNQIQSEQALSDLELEILTLKGEMQNEIN